MTKRELFQEFDKLQEEKNVRIDGIYQNCTKGEIQSAIDCLKCPDDLLDKYFTVFSLKYPNIAKTIEMAGDFKNHCYNRQYVYNTAKMILAD